MLLLKKIPQNLLLFIVLVIVGMFASCEDEPNAMGLEVNDPGLRISVSHDSLLQVNTYTYESENYISVSTSNTLLLGYMNDPKLGKFYNNAMAEFTPGVSYVDFDTLTIADSLVLIMELYTAYGDTTATQKLRVFEIDTTKYLSNLSGKELGELTLKGYYDPQKPLAEATYLPHYTDTTRLRINLGQELANRLIDTAFVDYYYTTANFNDYVFRGLYFESQAVNDDGGAISTIKMNDSTRLVLYTHYVITDTTTNTDSIVSDETSFSLKSSYKANIFKKEIKPEVVYNPMYTDLENTKEDSLVYLKNNNALYAKIKVEVKPWKDSILLNRAVLRIPVDVPETLSDSLYMPNPSFYATLYYDNNETLLTDHSYNNAVSALYLVDGYVSVYITTEMQYAIKNDEEELIIHLRGANGQVTANRSIIYGTQHPTNPTKLFVTYSKLNHY